MACGVDVTRTSLDFVSPTQLSVADTNSLMFQILSSGFSCHLYSFHGSALNCLLLLRAQTTTTPPSCFLAAASVRVLHCYKSEYFTLKTERVKEPNKVNVSLMKAGSEPLTNFDKGFAHK